MIAFLKLHTIQSYHSIVDYISCAVHHFPGTYFITGSVYLFPLHSPPHLPPFWKSLALSDCVFVSVLLDLLEQYLDQWNCCLILTAHLGLCEKSCLKMQINSMV